MGTNSLALAKEVREIETKIRLTYHFDNLQLVQKWAVRPSDLLQALLEHQPKIVQFSGHGSKSEKLFFEDQDGRVKPVSKDALVSLFENLKDNIRLVILNSCFSMPQAEAITSHIDCAIGMKKEIGDHAAIVFAAAIYQAIGFGKSVLTAFDLGKTALKLEGIPEEDTPQLLTRKGVDASKVFLLPPSGIGRNAGSDKELSVQDAISKYKRAIDIAWRGGKDDKGEVLKDAQGNPLGKWIEMETHEDFLDDDKKPKR